MRGANAARVPAAPAAVGDHDTTVAPMGICGLAADARSTVGGSRRGDGANSSCRGRLCRCVLFAAAPHGLERRALGTWRARRPEVVAAAPARRTRRWGVVRGALQKPHSMARTR